MTPKAIRTAWRFLSRRPSLSAVAILTLALGIGANTAMFSVVRSVLLDPLPFAEPERLVSIWPDGALARGNYAIFEQRARSYNQLAGHTDTYRASLVGGGEPLRLDATAVTASFFEVLGVPPLAGSMFNADASEPGRDGVVVIGAELFERRFGGDEGVIGTTIEIDGRDRMIVGVAPASLRFPSATVQAWVPLVLDPNDWNNQWGSGWFNPIGRLAEGASAEGASSELAALMPELRDAFPWDMSSGWGVGANVVSLRDSVVGDVRPALRLLFAAVAMVLLIACVNVANLLLAHHRGRLREMALRSALGGGRRALFGQLLTESLSLAVLGGMAGLLFGWAGLAALKKGLPADLPRLDEIALDGGVLAFTIVAALISGLVVGVLPAWRSSSPNLNTTLRDGSAGSGASRSHRRTAALLVVAQVTATLVLVIGAGLLVRSFAKQIAEPTGFETQGVLTAAIAPPATRYDSPEKLGVFYDELVERLEALPGVDSAAVADRIPFDERLYGNVFLVDGRPVPSGGEDWPTASGFFKVSPGFFDTLGLELERGRVFEASDRAGAPLVAVVSRSLAERYWPGEDAIGKRLSMPGGGENWFTIVGIVKDTKLRSLADEAETALFLPIQQMTARSLSVVLTGSGTSSGLETAMREQIRAVDAQTPISKVRSYEQLVATTLDQPRFTMALLGGFAGLALLLAMIGLYGVLSYSVAQRQQEMAIRLSLGAEPGRLQSMIVRQGAWLAIIGVVLGLPAAFAATRLLQNQLFGIESLDPVAWVGAAGVLLFCALLSAWLPAQRASKANPMALLRSE